MAVGPARTPHRAERAGVARFCWSSGCQDKFVADAARYTRPNPSRRAEALAPMSIMVGAGQGAGAAVPIRHAEALERPVRANTPVVDRIGTAGRGPAGDRRGPALPADRGRGRGAVPGRHPRRRAAGARGADGRAQAESGMARRARAQQHEVGRGWGEHGPHLGPVARHRCGPCAGEIEMRASLGALLGASAFALAACPDPASTTMPGSMGRSREGGVASMPANQMGNSRRRIRAAGPT